MQPTARHAESGFTLIEFMIAVLILTVGLFGLLTTLDMSIRHNSGTKMREHAVILAEQFLAEARATPIATLAPVVNAARQIQVGNAQVTYTINTTVTAVASPTGDLRDFDVTVAWNERGQARQHTISTLISNTLAN